MSNFEFVRGEKDLLDLVQPLWEKLNKHHENNSSYFSEKYRKQTFDARKAKFISDNNLEIMIDLIKDNEKNIYIGYCISTINKEMVGEIDSLFIEKEYRKFGLGDNLMKRALNWLDSKYIKTKIIAVAGGNENVLEFYKKYGFHKRRIILEQIQE
jgi:ribosomal protein S18 acetylase RimI-like enzyme